MNDFLSSLLICSCPSRKYFLPGSQITPTKNSVLLLSRLHSPLWFLRHKSMEGTLDFSIKTNGDQSHWWFGKFLPSPSLLTVTFHYLSQQRPPAEELGSMALNHCHPSGARDSPCLGEPRGTAGLTAGVTAGLRAWLTAGSQLGSQLGSQGSAQPQAQLSTCLPLQRLNFHRHIQWVWNQSQSSRIHLLASLFICTRSGSCTPVYGVIKMDFIWICRDSHLFPHSLFALIATLTQRYSSTYQFKQNFKHCLNVSKCIQKCNEVPLPPAGCVYCP